MTIENDYEYGTEEWRAMIAKKIVELSKDTPTVGYYNEKGKFIMPAEFRD